MKGEHKRYTVIINEDAANALDNHVRFLANVSTDAVWKLYDDFNEAFTSLETMPHRCPIYRTRRVFCVYRQLIVGRYQIIFSIEEEEENLVKIQYILDSRRDNDI